MDQQPSRLKTILGVSALGLFVLIVFGLMWALFLGPERPTGGAAWYLFSYTMGLTMIVLPCTLPLAFVIVPLSMGKGMAKGLGIAVAFGLGVAITLSFYGVVAAIAGKLALGTLDAPLETVKNWVYFIAGLFAYLFAMGEIGLLKLRMPTYTGAAPGFIQKQQDYIKALLLGLFLGNIGVGCPHPATPLIFVEIARAGDVFYGWSLFFVHAVGRVLPLLLLAFLGILGINALSWLVARKEKLERATGWSMVFIAGFILVLGLFTHDWWVNSGQHTLFEEITQEERFLGIVSEKLNVEAPHRHGPEEGTGLLGLPLGLGNWVLVGLWIAPLWWYYRKKKKTAEMLPEGEEKKVEQKILPWRFWFSLVLALLLVVTFAFYLPARFERNFLREEIGHTTLPDEEAHEDAHHGETRYHEEGEVAEGLAVNFNVVPPLPAAQASSTLQFFVNEKPDSIPVPDSSLQIEHEKLMHVIGVRDDMNEFFHIHPKPDGKLFAVGHTFAKPGLYKVWSEIKKDDVVHAFGHPTFEVQGEGPKEEKQVLLGRNVIVGDYQVALDVEEPVESGHLHDVSFTVHTLTSGEVELGNYLGAPMHLSIIKDDLTEFIHAHPEGGGHSHSALPKDLWFVPVAHANGGPTHSGQEEHHANLNFHVAFPEPGLYKLFAQFRPEGIDLPEDEALLAAFWVQVTEASLSGGIDDHPHAPGTPEDHHDGEGGEHASTQFTPLVSPEWWLLLIVSLVAITILSLFIYKFIRVK